MTDFTFADMEAIVRASLSTPPAGRLTGAETLAELGVDSLTVLNVIMAAADRFAIDLDALDSISSLPPTVGGLHEMLTGLCTACAAP